MDLSPRAELAKNIRAVLPGAVVDNYPNKPEQVAARRPYIDVYEVRRTFMEGEQKIEIDLEIDCYTGKSTPAAAEDDIEDIRDDVLTALQAMPGVFSQAAERMTYLDTYPGYKITVKQYGYNPYKPKE